MNQSQQTVPPKQTWQIEVFYDGDCPLCSREINLIRRMDRQRKIRFTDIAAEAFSANDFGKSWDQFMAEIHGRLPDGSWVRGVEVFRQIYSALGWRPVVWFSRLPIVTGLLNASYRVFARNRLRWTRRCTAGGHGCDLDGSRAGQKSSGQAATLGN